MPFILPIRRIIAGSWAERPMVELAGLGAELGPSRRRSGAILHLLGPASIAMAFGNGLEFGLTKSSSPTSAFWFRVKVFTLWSAPSRTWWSRDERFVF